MKIFIHFLLLGLLSQSCTSTKNSFSIPANGIIEFDYPEYEMFEAKLRNKSMKGIEVAVLSKTNEEQIRGFGLGTKGKAEVKVEKNSKLTIKNSNNTPIKVRISISEATPFVPPTQEKYINFTLENTSAKSIPLIIPTVMNPNLSPFSKSGVGLKVGQEIFFKAKGKKHILLVVDETIKEGDIIDVPKLLKERKKALNL